jgi:hypothetical protein
MTNTQEPLFLAGQRIGRSGVFDRKQLDLGRGLQPGLTLSIHPLGGGEIEDPAHDGERHVQGLRFDAIAPPPRDEFLQVAHMHLSQLQASDEGIELFQVQRVVHDASLMTIFLQVLRRRGPERAQLARTVELGFAR